VAITISDRKRFEEELSPFIYGDFVEFLDDLIPGMWAEKIRDRSFEGIKPLAENIHYRKELEEKKEAWKAFSYRAESSFSLDEDRPFSGTRSARIGLKKIKEAGCAGILQEGISVERGRTYDIQFYLRSRGISRIELIIGKWLGPFIEAYCKTPISGIKDTWKRFTAKLTSAATDSNAAFIVRLPGKGVLWVDKVSMMRDDNKDGWRADVVEAVKELKPGMLRFGGSSLLYYDWKTGIGPRERRTPFANKPWGGTESNDVGIDEFLRFCELTGCEPLICVNASSASPEDAADEVHYCNDSRTMKWGRARAGNGHPQSYNVKYWQVGNELSGEEYEEKLNRYCKAMKRADKSIILLSSFPSSALLKKSARYVDYVCPHYYGPDIDLWEKDTRKYRSMIKKCAPGNKIKLGVTEWNITAGDWGLDRIRLQTVACGIHCARMFNLFQRHGDLIKIANRSNLVNSFFSGCIQTRGDLLVRAPSFLVQRLYSNKAGEYVLKFSSSNKRLDISVTMSRRQSKIILFAANPASKPVKERIEFRPARKEIFYVLISTITSTSPDDVNSFQEPERVHITTSYLKDFAGSISYLFEPYSVTCIEFFMKRER